MTPGEQSRLRFYAERVDVLTDVCYELLDPLFPLSPERLSLLRESVQKYGSIRINPPSGHPDVKR